MVEPFNSGPRPQALACSRPEGKLKEQFPDLKEHPSLPLPLPHTHPDSCSGVDEVATRSEIRLGSCPDSAT